MWGGTECAAVSLSPKPRSLTEPCKKSGEEGGEGEAKGSCRVGIGEAARVAVEHTPSAILDLQVRSRPLPRLRNRRLGSWNKAWVSAAVTVMVSASGHPSAGVCPLFKLLQERNTEAGRLELC